MYISCGYGYGYEFSDLGIHGYGCEQGFVVRNLSSSFLSWHLLAFRNLGSYG